MREDITFDANEIQIGFMRDFERGLVCCFEHLNANRSREKRAHFHRYLFHQVNCFPRQLGFDVRKVMTVRVDDGVNWGSDRILAEVGQRLGHDKIIFARVAR